MCSAIVHVCDFVDDKHPHGYASYPYFPLAFSPRPQCLKFALYDDEFDREIIQRTTLMKRSIHKIQEEELLDNYVNGSVNEEEMYK